MATVKQHKLWHGVIIRELLEELGIEATGENIEFVKGLFKRYFEVASVSSLTEREYWKLIQATLMIISREVGIELPRSQANKTMEELLNDVTDDFNTGT